MKNKRPLIRTLAVFLALLLAAPQGVIAQGGPADKPFKQEELDQLLAPIALYPDSLLAQVLMAATYPLEVVQARRWLKANPNLKGDALAAALEQQGWDPSVKSLVNFPQVLEMMNEKLEWTQMLGDAFLAQQNDVMDTVQKLRWKAEEAGNLKGTEQQKVVVQKETKTIIIEPASPQVIYVPTYNPTVVYGPWWYPAYPPYYYYPPGYVVGATLFSFGVGVAMGAAWGYAWGHCHWGHHGHHNVNVNINQNMNINTRIDRSRYQASVTTGQGGRGEWKHNPEHRKGVSYRDQGTAQKFDRAASRDVKSREAFRGRADAGRRDMASTGADRTRDRQTPGRQDSQASRDKGAADRTRDRQTPGRQDSQVSRDKGAADRTRDRSPAGRQEPQVSRDKASPERGGAQQRKEPSSLDRGSAQQRSDRGAFGGYERGSQTKDFSNRGRESLSSSRAGKGGGSASTPTGGGGMSRGGGGGGRGGGGRAR